MTITLQFILGELTGAAAIAAPQLVSMGRARWAIRPKKAKPAPAQLALTFESKPDPEESAGHPQQQGASK